MRTQATPAVVSVVSAWLGWLKRSIRSMVSGRALAITNSVYHQSIYYGIVLRGNDSVGCTLGNAMFSGGVTTVRFTFRAHWLLAILALVLSACGTASTPSPTAAPTAAAPKPTTAPAAPTT